MWGWVCMRCVGARFRLHRCACVVSYKPRGLEEEVAVSRGCDEDFADGCAYLMYLSVVGRKRVLQRWA